MIRRRRSVAVAFALASLCGPLAAARQSPSPPPEASSTVGDRIAFDTIGQGEAATLTTMLDGQHWPLRVMGLIRLERYRGGRVDAIIRDHLHDPDWQVRCFAIRQAWRLGLALEAADLPENEQDPRVVRTALRAGVTLDEEAVRRMAARLMRTRSLDALVLGLEIAAASGNETLRRDAARRVVRLIRNMDGSVEAVVARRLTYLLKLPRPPESPTEWKTVVEKMGDAVDLRATEENAPAPNAPSVVAAMDGETFARLVDYLDVLKQRDLELAIVMDATASMLPMLNQARAGVDALILFLNDVSRTMRLAFIAYRDHDNTMPVWEGQELTADVEAIRGFLFRLRIGGGADLPEAVLQGFEACEKLEWLTTATRQIILVGDARPHDRDLYQVNGLVESFRNKGVTVNTVHIPMRMDPRVAAGMASHQINVIEDHNVRTAAIFKEIAAAGGGRMVTLSRAEQLVPSIIHMTLNEAWWPAFDEFYDLYVVLCR